MAPNTLQPPHLLSGGGERRVEPLLEGGHRLEDGGQQEVEQGPQLGQLVLERRPRQQQTVGRVVRRVEHERQLAVVVLHTVALVDDHVLPAALWRGREDVEVDVFRYAIQQSITLDHDVQENGHKGLSQLIHHQRQ